jgi:transcription elongation GreA/GreB family factor
MNKKKLWEELVKEIERELSEMEASMASTKEAVTHSESKQEGKYDTRGLEASYLAGGQQRRVEDLKQTYNYFIGLKEAMISDFEVASFGALIEVETKNKTNHYFMSRLGGGIKIKFNDINIQVITHESPLGAAVLGLEAGDSFEMIGPKNIEELELIKVF